MRSQRHDCILNKKPHAREGAMIVFLTAGIVMLLAMVMLSVDVATMQLARTELRAASDAAAKAGAEALLRTNNITVAREAARNIGALNTISGKPLKLVDKDIAIGTSSQGADGTWLFTSGGDRPNSVRINSLLSTGSASGPVNLAFGPAFKAGNFQPAKTSTAAAVEQEVCLVIDRSASMSFNLAGVDWVYPKGGDYDKRPKKGSRWDSLQKAVDLYMAELEDTALPPRVALVTWGSDMTKVKLPKPQKEPKDSDDIDSDGLGGLMDDVLSLLPLPSVTVSTDAALTRDYKKLTKMLKKRADFPIFGGTNLAAGIDEGVEVLTAKDIRPFAQRVMILMTDGQWNAGRNPLDAAREARDQGIMIHVVTFLPEALSADARSVAKITGGKYLHAENQVELNQAFAILARTLPVVLTD